MQCISEYANLHPLSIKLFVGFAQTAFCLAFALADRMQVVAVQAGGDEATGGFGFA